jgi:fatty-acyl-CoA synthase
VVRGSIMMKEYWQDPVQTEQIFSGGWLRTGDLALMDEDGYFYLIDRAKDMYISGGENVYPAEVERVLRDHPDVEDVAVIGEPEEKWGEVGHAFIIAREGASLNEEDVIAFCRTRLAAYKLPRKITFCASFPRTPLGKVRKFLLKQNSGKQ